MNITGYDAMAFFQTCGLVRVAQRIPFVCATRQICEVGETVHITAIVHLWSQINEKDVAKDGKLPTHPANQFLHVDPYAGQTTRLLHLLLGYVFDRALNEA